MLHLNKYISAVSYNSYNVLLGPGSNAFTSSLPSCSGHFQLQLLTGRDPFNLVPLEPWIDQNVVAAAAYITVAATAAFVFQAVQLVRVGDLLDVDAHTERTIPISRVVALTNKEWLHV